MRTMLEYFVLRTETVAKRKYEVRWTQFVLWFQSILNRPRKCQLSGCLHTSESLLPFSVTMPGTLRSRDSFAFQFPTLTSRPNALTAQGEIVRPAKLVICLASHSPSVTTTCYIPLASSLLEVAITVTVIFSLSLVAFSWSVISVYIRDTQETGSFCSPSCYHISRLLKSLRFPLSWSFLFTVERFQAVFCAQSTCLNCHEKLPSCCQLITEKSTFPFTWPQSSYQAKILTTGYINVSSSWVRPLCNFAEIEMRFFMSPRVL